VAELEIWEQLLKESYDAALDKLSTLDRQHPTPEAALPLFEAAHRAWQGWAEAECVFQRALAKEGSDRSSIGTFVQGRHDGAASATLPFLDVRRREQRHGRQVEG
jgi:hypothetical protein